MAPRTGYFVLGALALGFVDGATGYFLFLGEWFPPSSFPIAIVGLFLAFWWYRLDSDSRAYRRTPLMSVAVVGVTIFAMPYYLFRSRGFRQGGIATLIFIFVSIGYSAMGYLGQVVARAMRT
ncbi:MAG TPA: hypothetical protein VIY68_16250 [Steroidobacteraceae bacterium]